MEQGQTKLLRAPNLKRGRQDERITDRIKLESVFGVTLNSNAALVTDPNTGVIAYPAGCTVVVYNPLTHHQSHIINTSKKSITSLAFSTCGRYIVTGESGHQPAVRVWDLLPEPLPAETPAGHYPKVQQIGEFFGHKFGISCVAFSPSTKIIVSVGTQHDMIVNVWDWRNNIKLASNKVSTKVKSIAFAENGSYFVTVGNRLVKFWYLDCGRNKYKEAVPLMGRSAILGELRNNNFVDVACGRAECGDNTYAITRSGLLCEFNNRRLLDKWVELRTTSANSLSVGEKYIFVGCDGGIVRCFDPQSLQFVTTLPRTHYLGVDVALGLNITHMSAPPTNAKYPDAIALSYDTRNEKVTCVYNDHSIYVWDVHNIFKVGKSDSFLFHSACIWGVETAPLNCPLPNGSFLTCSSDDTIRVWTLDRFNEKSFKGMYLRNIYSKELLKVIYVDPEMQYLKDRGPTSGEKQENTTYDSYNGVRAIRLSPDGKTLASGDRKGNIRIHETTNMSEQLMVEAHDAEVLCLEFCQENAAGHKFMASASRDRLIHVFDVNREFNLLQTLEDHSSSITSVRFLNRHGNLQMITCGADRSLIFRSLAGTPNGSPQFQRSYHINGKNTLYDMEVDAGEKHVLTACQDRNVRLYSVASGKHTKSYKGSVGDVGSLIKICLDKSGMYLATSSTDKSLSVYDYYTGECMATMSGHSELATGLRFTNDCKRIISTSGDGCIFVWKVPHDMVVTMHARLNQQAMLSGKKIDSELENVSESDDEDVHNKNIMKRFSMGKLPTWAKKQMNFTASTPSATSSPVEEPPKAEKNIAQPKGRWAERATDMKNYLSYLSDVDVDSSLESDRDQTAINKTTQIEDAHDADVDSDQEYRQQPLYYPTVDSASGSEFTVTNIDTEELRKSVRRSKRASLPPLHLPSQTSASTGTGSQESDDDDDEASTPSGENTDVNPMSMLSTSMESLNAREKYLQATYESLSGSGTEMDLNAAGVGVVNGKTSTSISAQYHTRKSMPNMRNVAVVNAAKQTKNDVETTKKREHLNKMIADTRRKLQSIGYVSPLKSSQSICDLSHVPEKETRKDRLQRAPVRIPDDIEAKTNSLNIESSSMRRACSLSDLSHQGTASLDAKRQEAKYLPKNPQLARLNASNTRHANKFLPLTRSSSTSVLNPSDSEDGSSLTLSDKQLSAQSRLLKPTISSQNKVASKRKRHGSASNLSSVQQEDSSSEEVETVVMPPVTKPIVPPRTRLTGSFNNLREKIKPPTNTTGFGVRTNRAKWPTSSPTSNGKPEETSQINTIQEAKRLCRDVASNLTSTATEVVKLYDTLTHPNHPNLSNEITETQRTDMVKTLQLSIITTQKILQDLTLQILKQDVDRNNVDVNQCDSVKKLNDLIEKGFPTDDSALVNIMQQYCDILLGMIQQKIQN